MELYEFTLRGIGDLLGRGEISSEDVVTSYLERIASVDGNVGAFLTVTREAALDAARESDRRRRTGQSLSPMDGVPLALKDNLCTLGTRTTCGSMMLADFHPPYDATVVERLRRAGTVILGKLNMDEFAMGSSTENSAFFPTRNPWDLNCVPGGSSGGAAAAVAAGEAPATLGSDTGGSIRQPASFCGVVGMKPTYGRVSRYGLVAFASSLDQIGTLTRDVEDCAVVLQAISGHDPRDVTSADLPVPDYRASLGKGIEGMRVGIPKEYFPAGVDSEVGEAVRQAIAVIEGMGANCDEVSLPHTEYALPTYYVVAPAEASSNLARYDGVSYGYRSPEQEDIVAMYMGTRKHGFGAEVKRRVMLGTYALSSGYYDAYYLKALKVRRLIKEDFDKVFEKVDLLVAPTSPTVAFRLGERTGDPLTMYLSDICTIPVNLAGLPAISLPCGFSRGLPIGLQLIAPAFAEDLLLRAGHAYQQVTDYHRRRPDLEGKV